MTDDAVITLGRHIDVVPSIHQRSVFAAEVRRLFLSRRYGAVAVELPPFLMDRVFEGVGHLPTVTMAAYTYADRIGDEASAFVPIDPCDAIIEAVRLALPERIPVHAVDLDTPDFEKPTTVLPDEYAVRRCGLPRFYEMVKPFLPPTEPGGLDDRRERWMAHFLRALDARSKPALFVCGMGHLEGIRRHFEAKTPPPENEGHYTETKLYGVKHDTLAFLLGELPFLTYLWERARAAWDLKDYEETDGVKELLVTAREEFGKSAPKDAEALSPHKLQVMLTYLRNLCLMGRRMTPYLYEMVVAAKGVGGSLFATKVVEHAKYYPFLDLESGLPEMEMGVDQGRFPDLGVTKLRNRLPGPPVEWKPLKLKRPPLPSNRMKWSFLWNPFRSCSWPPEDDKIESFHRHVRGLTRKLLSEDSARVEKFTTSVKDGIDLRETIRNWHRKEIYVKEVPPARGEVEVVVMIFDEGEDDEKFPWRTTWYAEHEQESTLALYGTNYLEGMVGPGIARAEYGGCFLLFPPRPIPDIWSDRRFDRCRNLAERLTTAALFHSGSAL